MCAGERRPQTFWLAAETMACGLLLTSCALMAGDFEVEQFAFTPLGSLSVEKPLEVKPLHFDCEPGRLPPGQFSTCGATAILFAWCQPKVRNSTTPKIEM